MQSKALLLIAVLVMGGFSSITSAYANGDHDHGDGGYGEPGDVLGNICGTFNDTFISLDLHPAGGLPGDKTNVTVRADFNASGGALPQPIFEFMYSYVTFAWYRPSTGTWIADASGGIWYNPADDPSLTPSPTRPVPNNALITTWVGGVGSRTVNQFPVPEITVANLLPGEEIWLIACFAHPMPGGGSMDMNYTVAPYQVSICHTERDREMEIDAPSQGMPGEPITVTARVNLIAGDRPPGWQLMRFAFIDSTGNLAAPHVDVAGTLVSGTVDPSTGRLTGPGVVEATATLTVPDLAPGTMLKILACTGHPMGMMYDGTKGYHSLDFEVTGFAVVPEVLIGSIGLVGAALGSFILYARRRN
ncbi:MAG: hypothetical protein NZ517_00150 [Candidatus Nitrosocaldus sp.]|nr:hypothetical protein [Candidatus Nitrosocaldus sp.]